MFFLKLALHNLLRRYGRTSLSMVSIVVGVMVIITGRGAIDGLRESIIRGQIDSTSGHVMALPADYPTAGLNHPVEDLLNLGGETRMWLDQHAAAWTRRLLFAPRLVSGMDAIRVRAVAFDPGTDASVFPRDGWSVAGFIPEDPEDGVMLSRGVARVMGLREGDEVVLEARTSAGALNAMQIPVAGILASGNPSIDSAVIMVPMALAQELIRPGEAFSHLAVLLPSRADADPASATLQEVMGEGARTTTWETEAAPMLEAQDIRQIFLDVIALALLAMAAAGIANTILMAAYEREREVGTLRALGLTRRGVTGLFMVEGLVMGSAGSTLGAALGGWVNWHYSRVGIDMTSFIDNQMHENMFQDMPFSSMLYFSYSSGILLFAMVVGISIAVISSIYPAVVASRKTPAEAVRA